METTEDLAILLSTGECKGLLWAVKSAYQIVGDGQDRMILDSAWEKLEGTLGMERTYPSPYAGDAERQRKVLELGMRAVVVLDGALSDVSEEIGSEDTAEEVLGKVREAAEGVLLQPCEVTWEGPTFVRIASQFILTWFDLEKGRIID